MKRIISTIILIQLTFLNADNYSLNFDGEDDYVIINSSPELSGLSQFTLNLWLLKPSNSNVSNVESIVNKFGSGGQNGSNYEFDFYGEWQNSIGMGIKTTENNTFGVGIPGSSLQLDQWQNVAITYDGEYMKSYLDGQLMNTTSAYGTLLTTSEPINIGRYFGGYYFEGNIDEISFWNVALAESQIQSYMTTSPAGGEAGLVAYWNFNEGSGTTASDATSNGNDGTIYGATWSTDVPPPLDDGPVWYVATTGSDSTGDGSEENPFATIQHGVESSSDGDTVLVAAGTYVENINFNGKNIVVTSMEGSEETIIHGNENEERVVTFSGGEDSSAVLNGFTVTNGYGGIWCSGNSSPVISNNVIKENVGVNGGGISINARTENGENNPLVVDNMIINNYAFGIGWSGKGGGVYCGQNSEAVFKNNVIANNYAGGQSGGIEFWMSEVNLINNTIVNNTSDGDYGGIYMHYPTYADVVNTIVRGNSPGTQVVINCSWGGGDHTVISYSNIEGGEDGVYQYGPDCELVWGDGNIDAAPNFCSSYTGNYHLAEDSPCLGSGFDGANMGALGVGCENAVYAVPIILDIVDVPDDQGGRVYLEFVASMFDHQDQTNQSYTVFRYDVLEDTSAWVVVGSGGAIGDASYIYEVATLRDSTADDDGMTEFKVVASMNEGNFHSEPAMGYSVDNIAPSVPTGLIATAMEEGIYLTWDLSSEDDFQYFTLEKSLDADFTEIESFETIDTSFMDMEYEMNQTYFYRIVAVDHAGNISDYSETVEGAVLSIDSIQIPEVFALHQNYPNPFNPMTRISYDLPEDANISISIYDLMGRVVKTMVNTTQEAGYKSVIWNATNDYGKPVSAGVYLYQIQAGEFRQTRRMVLLK